MYYLLCLLIGFVIGVIVWENISTPVTLNQYDQDIKIKKSVVEDSTIEQIKKPPKQRVKFLRRIFKRKNKPLK